MRQTLLKLQIPFDYEIPVPWGKLPLFGCGLLLAVWALYAVWRLYGHVRRAGFDFEAKIQLALSGVIAAAIFALPQWLPTVFPRAYPTLTIPIYGFGTMLLLAFFVGGWFAALRLRREGLDTEIAWDVGMWTFVPGIIGARAFFIIQNRTEFFRDAQTPIDYLWAIVNLPNGGLVLFGGVILGSVGCVYYCYRNRIPVLRLGDIIVPSIFIGEMFGRIGCFLNGCCYGDPCQLPWGVAFPVDSVPFTAEVVRGQILPTAAHSLMLHPTQLYSSMNALVLAILTWNYFPYRRRHGEVLLLAWLAYPVTRFCLEILRDEPGQFGTPVTISQWVSLLLFGTGLVFWYILSKRPLRERERPQAAAAPVAAEPQPTRPVPA